MSFYLVSITMKSNQDNEDIYLKRDIYVYNNKESLREKISNYLRTKQGCYELIWVGIEINLSIYENYELKNKYDLHPYIIYEFPKYPVLFFDNMNNPIGIDVNNNLKTKEDVEFCEYFMINILGNEEIGLDLKLDNIADLSTGRLIDIFDIFSLPEYENLRLHYGYNDLEEVNNFSDNGDSIYILTSDDSWDEDDDEINIEILDE